MPQLATWHCTQRAARSHAPDFLLPQFSLQRSAVACRWTRANKKLWFRCSRQTVGKGNRERTSEGASLSEVARQTHTQTHTGSHCETVRYWSVWEGSTVAADRRRPASTTAVSPLPSQQEHHHHQTSPHLLCSHTTVDAFSRSPTQLASFALFRLDSSSHLALDLIMTWF